MELFIINFKSIRIKRFLVNPKQSFFKKYKNNSNNCKKIRYYVKQLYKEILNSKHQFC